MSKYTIYKFTNMTPLHLGMGRDTYDVAAPMLHSDTIASALAAIRILESKGKDVKDFLESFAVSSAFPYAGDDLFLPKPCGRLSVSVKGKAPEVYRKSLKKVKFVSFKLWECLAAGKNVEVEESQIHGAYLLDEPNPAFQNPMTDTLNQRVMVPRASGDSKPFTFNWSFFRQGCGLYCIVQSDSNINDELLTWFRKLGQYGIGSDRTVGGGHFDVEKLEVDLPDVTDGNATMLLSMYIPTDDELQFLNLEDSKYEIIQRGGFMAGSSHDNLKHLRKNSISMFVPGSTFIGKPGLKGTIVDLRPAWNSDNMHSVYRSGRPVSLTIKMN